VASPAQVCQVGAAALGICHLVLRAADLQVAIAAPGLAHGRAALSYGADDTLDVAPAGADKGAGVLRALALPGVGVDPRRAVGLGDSLNDLPMVAVLGRFVAMANSHPEVLAAAGEITGSVADHGVAGWPARAGMAGPRT
jgi:hypothetical protein